MKVILEDVRNDFKRLSDRLDYVDPEAIVRDYLPIFDEMKILTYWEEKPIALFDYVNEKRVTQGDLSMANAMTHAIGLEYEFRDLVKRAKYDKNVFNALRILASKHYQYMMSLPYIPITLRQWIVDYLADRLKPPTNEKKLRIFLRNLKIVMLLEKLRHLGIPPTRNKATKPGQYGMDIIGKIIFRTPESIATVWKNRYKYWDGVYTI